MSRIIEITDFNAPELDIYARLNENQLLNRADPSNALFIAEPVSWLGATLAVMLPYFYYKSKLLNNKGVLR
jgi:hypothetical protein